MQVLSAVSHQANGWSRRIKYTVPRSKAMVAFAGERQPSSSRNYLPKWLKWLPLTLALVMGAPTGTSQKVEETQKNITMSNLELVPTVLHGFSDPVLDQLESCLLEYINNKKLTADPAALQRMLPDAIKISNDKNISPDALLPLLLLESPEKLPVEFIGHWADSPLLLRETSSAAQGISALANCLAEALEHHHGAVESAYQEVLSEVAKKPTAQRRFESVAIRLRKIAPLYAQLNSICEAARSPLPSSVMLKYQPKLEYLKIYSSKFETRKTQHSPIFVIHETAVSGKRTLGFVNAPAYDPSFHVLILRDGTVIMMVPPNMTAYTAGLSRFRENPFDVSRKISVDRKDQNNEADPSGFGGMTVNHFAFQVELESPADGYYCKEPLPRNKKCVDGGGRGPTHSGYTDEQYQALAWLAVKSGIPIERITTHDQVDTTGRKTDPRSFDWSRFWACYLGVSNRTKTLDLGLK